jgi:hypothetical protein
MPNHLTFKIKPISEFISNNIRDGLILDPFANRASDFNAITNDINPKSKTDYHLDALDFLKIWKNESCDALFFDPPYSLRQLKECYDGIGLSLTHHQTKHFFSEIKNEIERIMKKGGVVFSFGWSSVGMGKSRSFEKKEILLVSHGGIHNDTICLLEEKF